jgi:hypothetical protein
MTVLAHTGHVLIDLAVFLGPLLVIGLLLKLADRPERSAGDEGWPSQLESPSRPGHGGSSAAALGR